MTDRRPICFFIPTLEPGGAERKTVVLANGFARRGRAVDLLVAIDADGLLRGEVHPAVRIVELKLRRSRYFFVPVRRYLRAARPRILVCVMHHAAVFGIVARLGSGTNTPIVIVEGGMNLTAIRAVSWLRYQALRAQIALIYRRAARIFVNAAPIAAELIGHAKLPAERLEFIPNPSACAVFDDAEADMVSDWPEGDAPVAIAVNRLDDNKDVATLLRAVALVRVQRPLRLVILGDGPERGALEAMARELGIAADVHFLGRRLKPWHHVRRAQLFLLSSRTEGFSNALVEAMAVGCPVVATDAPGGNAFVLEQGRHGALVPVGDAHAMAQAMAAMLDRPTPPAQLIERARSFAEGQIDAYLAAIERYAR
ncbi:glycosyltransferase [Sphingomonas sp. LB-2]|uniref:glycosyltransferase n=1 Tax=Sphingomonas caeni TaxID=2984949 RepID=UPI00222F39B2|nr:glycosyltransferase [Sphingomonas caeni]MCW3846632.1 glycosyltransferase [Sphingomonas caeni]